MSRKSTRDSDLSDFLHDVEKSAKNILKAHNKKQQLEAARVRAKISHSPQKPSRESISRAAPSNNAVNDANSSASSVYLRSSLTLKVDPSRALTPDPGGERGGRFPPLSPSPRSGGASTAFFPSSPSRGERSDFVSLPAVSSSGNSSSTGGGAKSQATAALIQQKLLKSPLFQSLPEAQRLLGNNNNNSRDREKDSKEILKLIENIKRGAISHYGVDHGHVHGRANHAGCNDGRMCLSCWSNPDKITTTSATLRTFSPTNSMSGGTMEAQGPTSWDISDLRVKYRGELEREEAWKASKMAAERNLEENVLQNVSSPGKRMPSKGFGTGSTPSTSGYSSLPMAVAMICRHPIVEKILYYVEQENIAASVRARDRNKMKVFVLNVHRVWMTNLEHVRPVEDNEDYIENTEEQSHFGQLGATSRLDEREAFVDEDFDAEPSVKGLKLRRDVDSILTGKSQIQSVCPSRAFLPVLPPTVTQTGSTEKLSKEKQRAKEMLVEALLPPPPPPSLGKRDIEDPHAPLLSSASLSTAQKLAAELEEEFLAYETKAAEETEGKIASTKAENEDKATKKPKPSLESIVSVFSMTSIGKVAIPHVIGSQEVLVSVCRLSRTFWPSLIRISVFDDISQKVFRIVVPRKFVLNLLKFIEFFCWHSLELSSPTFGEGKGERKHSAQTLITESSADNEKKAEDERERKERARQAKKKSVLSCISAAPSPLVKALETPKKVYRGTKKLIWAGYALIDIYIGVERVSSSIVALFMIHSCFTPVLPASLSHWKREKSGHKTHRKAMKSLLLPVKTLLRALSDLPELNPEDLETRLEWWQAPERRKSFWPVVIDHLRFDSGHSTASKFTFDPVVAPSTKIMRSTGYFPQSLLPLISFNFLDTTKISGENKKPRKNSSESISSASALSSSTSRCLLTFGLSPSLSSFLLTVGQSKERQRGRRQVDGDGAGETTEELHQEREDELLAAEMSGGSGKEGVSVDNLRRIADRENDGENWYEILEAMKEQPLSLQICNRKRFIRSVPGTAVVGRAGVRIIPDAVRGYYNSKPVAMFLRDPQISSSHSINVLLSQALDSPILAPLMSAWEFDLFDHKKALRLPPPPLYITHKDILLSVLSHTKESKESGKVRELKDIFVRISDKIRKLETVQRDLVVAQVAEIAPGAVEALWQFMAKSLTRRPIDSNIDTLLPCSLMILETAPHPSDYSNLSGAGSTGHRRLLDDFTPRNFRQKVYASVLKPNTEISARAFGPSNESAVPNAVKTNGRFRWHSEKACVEQLVTKRLESDYVHIGFNKDHCGSNDCSSFTILMEAMTMLGFQVSSLKAFMDSEKRRIEKERRIAEEEALKKKIEAGRKALEAKRAEQERIESELRAKESKRADAVKGKTKLSSSVVAEWEDRIKRSNLLETRADWEKRQETETAVIFYVCLNPQMNAKYSWDPPHHWEGSKAKEEKAAASSAENCVTNEKPPELLKIREESMDTNESASAAPSGGDDKLRKNGIEMQQMVAALAENESFLQILADKLRAKEAQTSLKRDKTPKLKLELGGDRGHLSEELRPFTVYSEDRDDEVELHNKFQIRGLRGYRDYEDPEKNNFSSYEESPTATVSPTRQVATLTASPSLRPPASSSVSPSRQSSGPISVTPSRQGTDSASIAAKNAERAKLWKHLKRTRLPKGFVTLALTPKCEGPRPKAFNLPNAPSIVGIFDPADDITYTPPTIPLQLQTRFIKDIFAELERAAALAKGMEAEGGGSPYKAGGGFDAVEEQREKADTEFDRIHKAILYVKNGKVEELEDVLNEGIPVNAKDENGNSLLMLASQQGNKRIVKHLLRRGADINSQNNSGNTALHYAHEYKFEDLAAYLQEKGANDQIANKDGLTCYEGLSRDKLDGL